VPEQGVLPGGLTGAAGSSVSFGARVIVPVSLIDTPFASPFSTSAREFTDQINGSLA